MSDIPTGQSTAYLNGVPVEVVGLIGPTTPPLPTPGAINGVPHRLMAFCDPITGVIIDPGSDGGGSFASITGAPTDNTALAAALTAKQNIAISWTPNSSPVLVSGTPLSGANAGINTVVNETAGTSTFTAVDGITSSSFGDVLIFGSGGVSTWTIWHAGGAYVGAYASAAAIQTAYPAASNPTSTALVGSVVYISNGTAWGVAVLPALTGDVTSTAGSPATTIQQSAAALNVQTNNAQVGTTYTFALGDLGQNVTMTNAAAITATIPPNSSVAYPVGAFLYWTQGGAGAITIAAGAGVTITKRASFSYTTSETLAGGYAYQISTNNWIVTNS